MFFILFTTAFLPSNTQSDLQKRCQQVLEKNIIDSSFSFNDSNKADGYIETILKYFGTITTENGRSFKVITYELIWGPNRHTSGRIYVYNGRNQYVGIYQLGDASDLPTQLKNDCLIFTNDDKNNCDKNLTTIINLKNGLPKKIFIKCQGLYGDLYRFSSDD